MNPYSFAKNIIKASEEPLKKQNDQDSFISKEKITIMLILLEICLDKSRAVAPPGTANSFPEEKRQVEQSLNNLRRGISKLVQEADIEKLEDIKKQTIVEIEGNFQ